MRTRSLLAILAAAALSFSVAGCAGVIRAARLLEDARRPPHELADRLDETEELVGGVPALLYRPREAVSPLPAVLLCHGAVEGGARDPRLVSLARAVALRDVVVVCPDLESLRLLRVDPEDPVRLAAVTTWLAEREDVDPERVAHMGISIGGSFCVVAASRPEVRDRVRAVLVFGGYEDLGRLVTHWMVSPKPVGPGLYDPLVEGRRLTLLGNVDRLAPPRDWRTLRAALAALVEGEDAAVDDRGLSPSGRRVLSVATSTEPIDPAVADALLSPLANDLRALSPGADGRAPAAEVYLLHGEADPVVPSSEIDLLRESLERLGARVRTHTTGVFEHVGADANVSLLGSWSLLRFVARFLRAAGI